VVVGMGRAEHPEMEPPVGLSNVVAIASGDNHYLALVGTELCLHGARTTSVRSPALQPRRPHPPRWRSGSARRHDSQQCCRHFRFGGLQSRSEEGRHGRCVGGKPPGQCNVPAGLNGVVAIAAGSQYCLAITTNSSSLALKK